MTQEAKEQEKQGPFGELPPGPWRWSRSYQLGDTTHWCLENDEHAAKGLTIDPSIILRLHTDTWLGEPFLNNPVARLLAASRELLDAAERYYDWTTMSVDDYEAKYPDTPGDDSPRRNLAAAIAKATGKD